MKFYVKNLEQAEASNDLSEPHVIISINWPEIFGEPLANPATNEYTREVLFLRFNDVGRHGNPLDEDAKSSPRCIPFNHEMARQVIDVIERNKVEHVILHCLGGTSRSASMGDALSIFYNDEKLMPWIVINYHVYGIMIEELVKYYGDVPP